MTKNLTIDQKQLDTIKNAQSLEEATKLGFIDRIMDKLFSRNKAEVHKQLYFLFQEHSSSSAEGIIQKAQAFDRLTQLVDRKYRSSLTMSVTQAPLGEQSHKVSFKFKLQELPFSLEFSCSNLPEELSPKSVAQQWLKAEQGKHLMLHCPCDGWQQLMEQFQQDSEEVIIQMYQTNLDDAATLESDTVYPDSISEEDKSVFQEMLRANKTELTTSKLDQIDLAEDTQESPSSKKSQAHGLTPLEAAGKIKKAYRNFRENKEAAIEDARVKGAKHAVMTNKDGTRYFVDPNGLFPMMRRPIYRPSQEVTGAHSKLDRADEQYVRFTHVFESNLDQTLTDPIGDIDLHEIGRLEEHLEQQDYFADALNELKHALPNSSFQGRSIQAGMQGFLDDQGRRIAVNGGENTKQFVDRTNTSIPLQAFHIACEDLASAHKHGIYFRDIKNENLLYRDHQVGSNGRKIPIENPKVNFIDLDEMYTPNYGSAYRRCGAEPYMTTELLAGKEDGDKSIIESADNYAMLISLLQSVSVTIMKNIPTYSHSRADMFEHGILHEESNSAEHRAMLNQVLTQVIKPEHLEQVQNFLREPTEYPLENPLDKVINWQASL
ncbi:hypothetical protein [Parashewanella curva]|uniref:hypothetical protein n=1 Tax=Parashewanella curva TaxID=2338552 RepID=UPI0010598D0A|nr:hypothetical protein [Parashewanella curva]